MEARKSRVKVIVAAIVLAVGSGIGIATAQLGQQPTRLINTPCNDYPEGQRCASGLCINVTVGHVCTHLCSSDADCTVPNWGCKVTTQGNGEKIHYCAPKRVIANP
jgi:hypothetical protein